MKRKTERLLRSILLFVDQQIDELMAQEDSPKGDSASESESTPVSRVRAKLEDLALNIEFELQLNSIRRNGARAQATGEASQSATLSSYQKRHSSLETTAAVVQSVSPFQMMVDQWFLDHPIDENSDFEEHDS